MRQVVNVYAAVSYFRPAGGRVCAIRPQILQIGALMYVLYGALFMQLFWRRYLGPNRRGKARPGAGAGGANGQNGHGARAEGGADVLLKVV